VFFLKNARALLRAIKKISRDETQICAELCEIRTRLKREGLGVGGGGGGGGGGCWGGGGGGGGGGAVTLSSFVVFSRVFVVFVVFGV